MVHLDQLWDDVVAGPPGRGLKHLKRVFITTPLNVKDIGESSGIKLEGSSPGTPVTPGTPSGLSPNTAKMDNAWQRVFHPGSNPATKGIGSNIFDKPHTVYDCSIFCWLD